MTLNYSLSVAAPGFTQYVWLMILLMKDNNMLQSDF